MVPDFRHVLRMGAAVPHPGTGGISTILCSWHVCLYVPTASVSLVSATSVIPDGAAEHQPSRRPISPASDGVRPCSTAFALRGDEEGADRLVGGQRPLLATGKCERRGKEEQILIRETTAELCVCNVCIYSTLHRGAHRPSSHPTHSSHQANASHNYTHLLLPSHPARRLCQSVPSAGWPVISRDTLGDR